MILRGIGYNKKDTLRVESGVPRQCKCTQKMKREQEVRWFGKD